MSIRSAADWLQHFLRTGSLGLLFVFTVAAGAQQTRITLDPTQTAINWTLGATLHTVHGTFKLVSGTVLLDLKTGNAGGEIVVNAKSGESGDRTRDGKMQKEVLESDRFPEITFLPRHVSGTLPAQGTSTLHVQGTFRIHGSDHDLTLSLPVQVQGTRATATAQFEVPYQAWGMKNPSTFFLKVDNKVVIEVSAAATAAPDPIPAGPK